MQRNKLPFYLELSFCVVCIGLTLVLANGCSKSDETLHDYFVRTQADVETPDGKAVLATVTVDEDHVYYQTEQGGNWRVGATKESDGYSFSNAERVEYSKVLTPDS